MSKKQQIGEKVNKLAFQGFGGKYPHTHTHTGIFDINVEMEESLILESIRPH